MINNLIDSIWVKMDTLCIDVLTLIFNQMSIVDISNIHQLNSNLKNLVNQYLTERVCIDRIIQSDITKKMRKPTTMSWRQFLYFFEMDMIRPLSVNDIKTWVGKTVTFHKLGLEIKNAEHIKINYVSNNIADFNQDTQLFPYLTGKTFNSIVYNCESHSLSIVGW